VGAQQGPEEGRAARPAGKGLKRVPDPGGRKTAEPSAECRSCHASLHGAAPAEPRWAQVIDVEILRRVTEVLLPGLACGDCGAVTHAPAPPGFHAGSVAYGPVLNAAVILSFRVGQVRDLRCPVVDSVADGTLAA